MPPRLPLVKRFSTAARWPLGVALTSWRYMWRTTPTHRWEMTGSLPEDAAPPLAADVALSGIQRLEDGVGPLMHRIYRVRILVAQVSAEQLIERLGADLDEVAPSEFASFQKVRGDQGSLTVGDEFIVRMPGPWDGPVRVVAMTPKSFRLATLDGHLEAGQIEFRSQAIDRSLLFVIESWARSGDRFSDLLYSRLRMAKEIQLHMWMSVLERVVRLTHGRRDGGIVVTTQRVDFGDHAEEPPTGRRDRRAARMLEELRDRQLNFEPREIEPYTPANGWHVDDMTELLPREPPGDPIEGGSWEIARSLMTEYQVADPRRVRARYRTHSELAGRDMLLQVRFALLHFHVGVRVGEVYDEIRTREARQARVFGWGYKTLEGHFEQGQLNYEVWKWLETGVVEFRVHAYSRVADTGPPLLRLGFRVFGRGQQLQFYRQACRRMRRLTESRLEVESVSQTSRTASTGRARGTGRSPV